jgi:hypothetical protein
MDRRLKHSVANRNQQRMQYLYTLFPSPSKYLSSKAPKARVAVTVNLGDNTDIADNWSDEVVGHAISSADTNTNSCKKYCDRSVLQ